MIIIASHWSSLIIIDHHCIIIVNHWITLSIVLGSSSSSIASQVALGDRYRKFYRTLNNAKKPFNSIFNSKTRSNYSFKEFIHSKKSQIIHSNKIFIQIITQGYGGPLPKNSLFSPKNTVLGLIFKQFIHFTYEYCIFSFIQ